MNLGPVYPGDRTSEPILDVRTKLLVRCQLRRLGAPGLQLGFPLRNGGPIADLAAPRGRVAAQLP